MKLFDPKLAKQEIKSYGLYDYNKKIYKLVNDTITKALPSLIKTNEYYKSL